MLNISSEMNHLFLPLKDLLKSKILLPCNDLEIIKCLKIKICSL